MRHLISILFVFLCLVFVCLAVDSSKILKDVCKSNPKLKVFQLRYPKGYEKIDEDAFKHCNELTKIYLMGNNWQKIPQKTFKNKGLSKLTQLLINGGNIPIIDLDLTDLKELKILWMTYLNITILPSKTFEGLTNLIILHIDSNHLFDLDIEGIFQFTPNLKKIYLRDNNFKCSRLSEIIPYLKNKNVRVGTYASDLRNRNYTPQKLEGIECLNDEQWQAELEANGLESYSLECLRGQPECTSNEKVSESTSNYTNTQVENFFNESQIELKALDEKNNCNVTNLVQKLDTLMNYHETQKDLTRLENKIDKVNEKLEAMESEIFDQSNQSFGIFRNFQNAKLAVLDQKITAIQETMKEIVKTLKSRESGNDLDEDFS